ncbi:hypothetical protein Moror_8666 [Moniliophthora roreri MCA 2997]|uniref:Arrestin-like N-terminal domain-containing protein n=1 Tax=Moniliophthora roreri (strain MCA 2997) TaxID=1381753 RepID=V2XAS6_MONRO|nr:hypothetical protein Moror_8666 [Moniliophthora roreri MCA 2997]
MSSLVIPKDGDEFKCGESIKLRVETDPHPGVKQLGVAVRIEPCECWCYADGQHGGVLYSGEFKPYYTNGRPELNYHDTFEVTIPHLFAKGNAVISVAHSALVGYSKKYHYDTTSVTIHMK